MEEMKKELSGKVALVTGAGRGIGLKRPEGVPKLSVAMWLILKPVAEWWRKSLQSTTGLIFW